MKKRSPVGVFILSLITLGIYDLYWLVVTKKELNAKTHTKTPTIWLLFAPFIVMFAGFILLTIDTVATSSSSLNNSGAHTAANIIFLLVYIFAFLIILPVTFFWFFKFSKAVDEYTNGKMSTGVTFLLLWLLHLLGVAIVQDTFNDMIDAGVTPASAPAFGGAMPPAAPEPPTTEAPSEQPPAGHHHDS